MDTTKRGRPKRPEKGSKKNDAIDSKLTKSDRARAASRIKYEARKRRKSGEAQAEEWVCNGEHSDENFMKKT